MNKETIKLFFKNAQDSLTKHSPEILTGIGIAGIFTTTVLAVRATPKALRLIADEREFNDEPLTKLETIKVAWKPYIPAVISGSVSVACLIGAQSVNTKRNAALATAYKLSEEAFSIYKGKVIETIGEKKEQVIRDKVAEERITQNPVSSNEVIVTEKGNTLCYDSISGRYFKSDIETIKKAVNTINYQMLGSNYVSLSDFYDEIGLSHTRNSDDIGWNVSTEGMLEVTFSSHIADDGTPAVVIDYMVGPRYDYWR